MVQQTPRTPRLRRIHWIHFESEAAGLRLAAIISVIESCRRLKIPVRDYLADILPGLANAPLQSIADLTPVAGAAKMPTMHLV
jgi:transposase